MSIKTGFCDLVLCGRERDSPSIPMARFRNIFLNAKNCLTRIFSYFFHGFGIPGVWLFFAYSDVASQHVPGDFMMSGVRLPGSLQRGPFMVQPKQAGKVENQLYIKKQ